MKFHSRIAFVSIGAFILSQPLAQATLVDGLVAYHPLNGSTADATGNGYNGVVVNTSYGVDRHGVANGSLAFNGLDSELVVDPAPINFGQTAYTISLWFQLADATTAAQPLVFTSNRTPGLGIMYNDAPTVPDALNWAVGDGVGPGWIASYEHGDKTDYVSGSWYQMAFTKNDDQFTLYVDGLLESTLTVPNSFSFASGLDFGFLDGAQYLDGSLDDIRIYDRALSADEVAELHNLEAAHVPDSTLGWLPILTFLGLAWARWQK